MPRFVGRYEHSLDTKGRVVLPARYRANFETRLFLSKHFGKCVALWTPDEFDKLIDSMDELQSRNMAELNKVRVWASSAAEAEIDRQGRVQIPQWLRTYAGLEDGGEVLVMGAIQRIELWNREEWETRVLPAEEALINPSDLPFGPRPDRAHSDDRGL